MKLPKVRFFKHLCCRFQSSKLFFVVSLMDQSTNFKAIVFPNTLRFYTIVKFQVQVTVSLSPGGKLKVVVHSTSSSRFRVFTLSVYISYNYSIFTPLAFKCLCAEVVWKSTPLRWQSISPSVYCLQRLIGKKEELFGGQIKAEGAMCWIIIFLRSVPEFGHDFKLKFSHS